MNRTIGLAVILALGFTAGVSAQELKVSRIENCQPFATGRKQCAVVISKVDCGQKRFVEPHVPGSPVNLSAGAAKQSENRWKIGQLSFPRECEPFVVEEMSEGIIAAFIDAAKLGATGYVDPETAAPVSPAASASAVALVTPPTAGPSAQPASPPPPALIVTSAVMGPEGMASGKAVAVQIEQAKGIQLLTGDLIRVRQQRTLGVQESQFAAVAVLNDSPVWRVKESAAFASNVVFDGAPYTVWMNINTGPKPHDRIEAELIRQNVTVARWSLSKVYSPQPDWFRLERDMPAGTIEPAFEPGDQFLIRIHSGDSTCELDLIKAKLVQAR